jgi:hypothetical protein
MDRAGINLVKVKLDPENNKLLLKSGVEVYIDNTFEPEKHLVLLGTVESLPQQLSYSDKGKKMPWLTDMELQVGDKVVMYYLGVFNCISKERKHYIKEGENTWIFIKYELIYALSRDGEIIPVNGYLLAEPREDPEWERKVMEAEEHNFVMPDLREPSKTHVAYGEIAYVGKPNKMYVNKNFSDDHVEVSPGDKIIMKRVRDIPVEYEYHTKMDGGRKLYRLQRHDILAVL